MKKKTEDGKVIVRQLKILKNIKNLPKGKKILVFAILTTILLVIATLVVYTFVFKDKNVSPIVKEEDPIIVVKDNYKYIDGVLNFLNDADQVIGTYECENKSTDNCYVAYETDDDNFDETKTVYEDGSTIKVRSKIYFNRYAFVYDNALESNNIILYDFEDNTKLGDYLGVKSFYNNMLNYLENNYVILTNLENKYGIFNLDSDAMEEIIPFNYDYLGVINSKMSDSDSPLVYKDGNKWGLLSFEDKKLITTSYEIKGYNSKYVKVIDSSNSYVLLNYENQEVLNSNYIDLLDDYVVTVDKDKKMFIYDNNLVRLMSNKLVLNNNDYIKTNIYDENNELIETKISYEVSVLGDILYVDVYKDGEKTENKYNILEAKLSNLYDYYSYENEKLYFYSDLNKENLIGSYTCNNKNAITDTSTSFTSCFLAKDGSATDKTPVTPIFNERFVFVNDAPILVGDTTIKIKLYDLKLKKLLGEYINVYAYSSESTNKNGIYLESNLPKYVIAVNKDSEYGLLKIDENQITKAISFIYTNILVQGSYLLGQTGSTWALLDYEGNMILDNTYLSYKFYDNFIAVVDETNKLHLFDYDKKALINEPVQLSSATEEYDIELSLGVYTITTETDTYHYNSTTGDKIE